MSKEDLEKRYEAIKRTQKDIFLKRRLNDPELNKAYQEAPDECTEDDLESINQTHEDMKDELQFMDLRKYFVQYFEIIMEHEKTDSELYVTAQKGLGHIREVQENIEDKQSLNQAIDCHKHCCRLIENPEGTRTSKTKQKPGRKIKYTKDEIENILELRNQNMSYKDICSDHYPNTTSQALRQAVYDYNKKSEN